MYNENKKLKFKLADVQGLYLLYISLTTFT